MTTAQDRAPSKVFTTFGTVLYLDPESGELRHGPAEAGFENVVLVADGSEGAPEQVLLVARPEGRLLNYGAGQMRLAAGDADAATAFERVPLERGLFGLAANGLYLCAELDGRVRLSREVCSIWESFLGSEPWCGAPGDATDQMVVSDAKAIRQMVVNPRLRVATGVGAQKLKILIYGYPKWSHGRVWYDLSKQLHARGYIIDIVDWMDNHGAYFGEFRDYYDVFLASPDGVRTLIVGYEVTPDRIIAVSHSESDIRVLIEQLGVDFFDQLAGYGVVSQSLYAVSLTSGVRRVPQVTPLGVDYAEFFMPVPERLETVGYPSSMSLKAFDVELKRGYLAEEAARQAGLAFKVAGSTALQMSFHDMPQFYRSVDATLTSSISESGPLTVMEAAAAGRLVICTPVGHFPVKATQGGGIVAPIEANKFVAFAAQQLVYYRDNPSAFVEKCLAIQEAARGFDWAFVIDDWVGLIEDSAR